MPVHLHPTLSPRLNLAFHQNAVPFIRELVVVNDTAAPVQSLEITLASEPAFLKPRTWRIESVAAGQTYHISDLDVALDGALLGRLTEAETAQVTFVTTSGGAELHRVQSSVELLPRNHWGGLSHVPEMVAAFVQPNDPAVDRILKKAAEVLREHGKPAGLDGCQGGAKRAWELASALWTAIGSLGIDYALPPASFERVGQKVRSPGQIVDGGIATCLDSTLLYCAAIEQCGLNPLVVFTRGHAFAGVWLKAEDFTNAVVDDVTALRKRVKLNEMVLVETTLAAQRPCPAFSHAIDQGARHIAESEDDAFELAVDVRRARLQRIRPLSATEAAMHAGSAPDAQPQPAAFEEAPDLADDERSTKPTDSGTPRDRLDRWQRKLLDLSLRNNLLNFRPSKRSVRLVVPDAGKVEDALALGRTLKLLPRPDLMDGADPRSQAIHESRHREDLRRQHALEALERDEVLVELPREELDGRLVELYRTARATLQEGGANTLYLALGFLSWTVADKDDKRCRAPLILVPVTLTRRSVRSGFAVTLHEDEPRFNPTLLEMLRQDFQLVLPVASGELPRDDRGLDVAGIWKSVAHAIKDIGGWEVVEDVVLATFSFAKYLMWKDLVDRTDELKQNPVVRHLIDTPRDPYPSRIAFTDPRALDATQGPERTFCPLPSDSSQLAAIVAAAQGKDFVLIGPPGTGKSQTISNLISQCLAEGKTVLFVSEKIAALDVVYRRLRAVELGDFCLELHSSKARKLDVLDQLRKAWNAQGSSDNAAWHKEAERMKALRDELNLYVAHLHRRHRNGLSAFAAMGRVVAHRDDVSPSLAWPSPDMHDEDALDGLRDLAHRLDADLREVKTIADGPFGFVAQTEWSPGWQQALVNASRELILRSDELRKAAAAFRGALALAEVALDRRGRNGLAALARALPQAARRDWRFVLRPDAAAIAENIAHGLELLARHRALTAELSLPYRAEASQLDLAALQSQWNEAGTTWWPRSWLMRRTVTGALVRVAATAGTPNAGEDLPRLSALRELEQSLAQLDALRDKTGGVWSGLATNVDEAGKALQFRQDLAGAVAGLASDTATLTALTTALEPVLGAGNALLEPTAAIGQAAEAYASAFARFQAAHEKWSGLAAVGDNTETSTLSELADACRALVTQEPRLRAWCAWRKARAEAVAAGLGPLVDAMEAGAISPGSARDTFETAYCRWWINATVDHDEVLRGFVSAEHEKRIDDFKALDERYTALTRAHVRARLCASLPDLNEVPKASEWGLLRREMEKKRRHLPLRELIGSIPSALTKLTPCLLMSPLSIAQYLPAGAASFDVVVFDEASQIPVWDAVGAIARGKQVVMVGDPKQLPPTSFFERAEEDGDDDIEIEGDLESILDECMGANLPTVNLAWHYRSRHESLIAFSNHRYYGGGLVTFPSPVTDDRAVSFHLVKDGLYEKGGARINKPEAQALVADLVARLRTPGFAESKRTIGVVTFNVEQQRLIEDLLDEERRKDPSIEPHFAEDALEPVFVKNLESVQGDERDIMYFSITYGPDKTGTVSMNFGPMNRDGGQRRLNVAVTRARHALRVYSTLTPDRIDLSRTQAIGVRDLKHFLEFAERGPRALAEAVLGSVGDHDSAFEKAVCEALSAKGWTVHPQVGVSSFRIDLGVVDPDVPGRYLAGLECDGATYHRSATARDRDKLRELVLRDLGWTIERIWSTDWWQDAQSALARLHGRLEALLAEARASREANVGTPLPRDEPGSSAHDSAPTPVSAVYAGAMGFSHTTIPAESTRLHPARWSEADAAAAVASTDAEAFHDPAYDATLETMIAHVVRLEAPLRADVLAKRIARAHGWARTGIRIRDRVLDIAKQRYALVTEDSEVFIWPAGLDTSTWPSFRRPDGMSVRPVDEIALPELIALAAEVRSEGFEGEAAIQAMARAAGLQQLRAATRARLESAWTAVSSR